MNKIIKKLIIFLIRKKLRLKKNEYFVFSNQKEKDVYYYFNDKGLIKIIPTQIPFVYSEVSLNWLLNDNCKIKVVGTQWLL